MRASNLFSTLTNAWEFPGGAVVRIPQSEGPGSILGWGTATKTKNPASHHSKHLIRVNSVNPHKKPMTLIYYHQSRQTSQDKHIRPVEILYWQGRTDRSVNQTYVRCQVLGRKLHSQEEWGMPPVGEEAVAKGFFYFLKKMFIYLADLGLSGGMQYPLVVGGGI